LSLPTFVFKVHPAIIRKGVKPIIRVLKKGASGRDPVLRGFCKRSHVSPYAALSKAPRALADGLMLVLDTLL